MMGAIGSSLHTDMSASLQANHEPIVLVDSRIETSATAPQPSRVARADVRHDHAGVGDPPPTPPAIVVAPMAAPPSSGGGLPVAPPASEAAPATPLGSQPGLERSAAPVTTAAATIVAPPPAIDQSFTSLVIDNLAHLADSTSSPRRPSAPFAMEPRRTPAESFVPPPPRTGSAALAISNAKPNPKGRLGKQRASVKQAPVAEPDIDPDAPPRTWDGIARLQLNRTAP